MTTWTTIANPTLTTWGYPANPQGDQIYDEATLTYDDATTYYDSTNTNQWTTLTKATGTTWTTVTKAT